MKFYGYSLVIIYKVYFKLVILNKLFCVYFVCQGLLYEIKEMDDFVVSFLVKNSFDY